MEGSKLHIFKKALIVLILVLSIATAGVFLVTTQLKTITLDYYGKKQTINTLAADVNDFLIQNKISLGDNDKVEPSKETLLEDGISISITSEVNLAMLDMEEMSNSYSNPMTAKVEEVIETIPFEEEKRNNPAIDRGTENTLQEGVEGQRSIRYIVKYDNGQEIERSQISNEVISEAKNQVIEVGTKLPVVVSRGGVTRNSVPTEVDSGFRQYNISLPVEQQKFAYNLCKKYGLQYELFLAVMYRESGYNPNAYGGAGNPSYGLCQIYATNHAWLRNTLGISNFFDPYDNMTAGAYLLSRYFGTARNVASGADVEVYALNSYNMGEGIYYNLCNRTGTFQVVDRVYSNNIIATRNKLLSTGTI